VLRGKGSQHIGAIANLGEPSRPSRVVVTLTLAHTSWCLQSRTMHALFLWASGSPTGRIKWVCRGSGSDKCLLWGSSARLSSWASHASRTGDTRCEKRRSEAREVESVKEGIILYNWEGNLEDQITSCTDAIRRQCLRVYVSPLQRTYASRQLRLSLRYTCN